MELYAHVKDYVEMIALYIALAIDLIAILIISIAVFRTIANFVVNARFGKRLSEVDEIRLILGQSLVLALEYLIAADILRTAVVPTWTQIGQLGAIIILRTILDLFLEREIRDIAKEKAKESKS